MNYLLVFLGGGLGSICRFGIAHLMSGSKLQFPWATTLANVLACFVLGALVALAMKNRLADGLVYFLIVGFCGGFSTFSTFTNETFQLMATAEYGKAFLNVGVSLLVCLGSLFLGMKTVG
jgi:CrcB protein